MNIIMQYEKKERKECLNVGNSLLSGIVIETTNKAQRSASTMK